jgi:hypothetical protein
MALSSLVQIGLNFIHKGESSENITYILKTRRFTGTNFYSRNKDHSKINALFQNELVNDSSFI